LRTETFAHGRYGEKKQSETEWIFTEEEFDGIAAIMKSRFEAMSLKDIFGAPQPVSLLYAWSQVGDSGLIKNKFTNETQGDSWFVQIIGKMSSVIHSSDGNYEVIKPQEIALFMEPEEAIARLEKIRDTDYQLKGPAEEVLRKIARARDF
jgi:hypothetical protein